VARLSESASAFKALSSLSTNKLGEFIPLSCVLAPHQMNPCLFFFTIPTVAEDPTI
jgi:hypothetical protein